MKRWIIYVIVASVVFLAGASLAFIAYVAPSGTGYQAKILCSGVFVSGRDPQTILREEFAGLHPLMALIDTEIDREAGEVRAALLGLGTRRAFWRDALGCTLAGPDGYLAPVALPPKLQGAGPKGPPTWPSNPVRDLSGVNDARLDEALDEAFAEPDPDHPRHTRAVVVLKGGTLVAERYAQGLSRDTPLAGWSMSKTITGALVGILVGQGRLDLHAPAPVPEWHSPGDSRRRITLEQLLHMSSGLAFDEGVGPLSDLMTMLYRSPDMAAYAAAKPLAHAPGSVWSYSSGTSNILSRMIFEAHGRDQARTLSFAHQALFGPLGMRSATFEVDATGTLVGSSYVYATALDWARFGQLYLQDGVWGGKRILPEGWVAYTGRPAPHAPKAQYGAHVWLNQGRDGEDRLWPDLPQDVVMALGFGGQVMAVVPSHNAVIVRLGESRGWDFGQDTNNFVASILRALE